MSWSPNRRSVLQAGAATLLAGSAIGRALAADIPSKPEAGAIKMGIEPWLGYGQWHIAAKKGICSRRTASTDVEIVNFTTDADINAALAAGQLQCGNIATHTAMSFTAAGLPIKIVALLDVSKTADAIISDGSKSDRIADLKGKQVAYEEGTTSDILLNYALAAERHDHRRHPEGADARLRCRRGADRRAGAGGRHLRALSQPRQAAERQGQDDLLRGRESRADLRRVHRARGIRRREARADRGVAQVLGRGACRLQG